MRALFLSALLIASCSPSANLDPMLASTPRTARGAAAAPVPSATMRASADPASVTPFPAWPSRAHDPARVLETVEEPISALELHDDDAFVITGPVIHRIHMTTGKVDADWFYSTATWGRPEIAVDRDAIYTLESLRGDVYEKGPGTVMVAGVWATMAISFHRRPYDGPPDPPWPKVYVGKGTVPYAHPAVGGCGLVFFTGTLTSLLAETERLEKLERIAKPGGPRTIIATQTKSPSSVAVDDANAYWAEAGPLVEEDAPRHGAIRRVSCNGGRVTNLADQDAPERIAVRGNYVYWLADGELRRIAKSGGQPEKVATARAFTVDDTHVYWADSKGIRRSPTTAIAEERLLEREAVSFLRVDAQRIVFATENEVSVLPKPPS